MIKNSPHDFKLDIWCLGVLLFELIHGTPPFKGKTENEKFKSILNNGQISFDDNITKEARDLIRNILQSNPNERLTMDQIFHHPWMMQFEKSYKIKIDKYIWKEDANTSMVSPTMNILNENNRKKSDFANGKGDISAIPMKKGLFTIMIFLIFLSRFCISISRGEKRQFYCI